ncbi:MAG: hypothetical protein JJE13_08205 [Thermoleophilia bacterium]|nr:hypothetical protein [Thermoleophilia bacterium]
MLALFAIGSIAAGNAAAGKHGGKRAKVTIQVRTKNQAALLKTKKLNLKIRATAPTIMRVKVKQGGKTNRFANIGVRFNKAKTKRISVPMNKHGREKLATCGVKTVTAIAKYSRPKHGKKNHKATQAKRLEKKDGLCVDPYVKVPLGDNPQNCDFLDTSICLQPFPDDYYTKPDSSTDTGLRLNLAADSTPVNTGNAHPDHMSVTDINRADGFSPGNEILIKIPGLDNPAAFAKSGLVPLNDIGAYKDPNQAVVLIDATTGERQPIWAELDSNPTTVDPKYGPDGPDPNSDPDLISAGGINQNPGNTGPVNLIIRPAKNLASGHRFIIAFRNLKNADGETIPAPTGFEVYRDNEPTQQQIVENRRPHMESVINDLSDKAGIGRSDLYMAWDFTVASEKSLTGRMTEIRDDAFARLGDTNLANRKIEGNSPNVDVLAYCDYSDTAAASCGNNYPGTGDYDPDAPATSPVPNGTTTQRTVVGYVKNVPCYLDQNGCPPGSKFSFDADDNLTWNESYTMDVPFRCIIPKSTVDTGTVIPGGTGTYGHGLLGTLSQINATEQIANATNSTYCAANFDGFSELDLSTIIASLGDMSNFNKAVDRMQQGFLNFLMVQRALDHPDGLATDPAFQMDHNGTTPITPGPAIDTSQGADTRGTYFGSSQGGIMGGAVTAISPDTDRDILRVPGINYSTLLRRSVDSDKYFKLPGLGLYSNYPDLASRPLLLSLVQLLWDRGEGNGYAENMTDNPLENTPPHHVLLQLSLGDHQVSNFAAEVEARTIGVKRYSPTLAPSRTWDEDYEALPPVDSFPTDPGQNYMVYYDGGPPSYHGHSGQGSAVEPLQNVPPRPEWGYGGDPHHYPAEAADALEHERTFVADGTLGACTTALPAAGGICTSNSWNGIDGLSP